jgi:hypothetical protein
MEKRQRTRELLQLVWWLLIVSALATLLLMLIMTVKARSETCARHPDMKTVEKVDGWRWRWANIDGRKCWYYAPRARATWELVWTYTEQDFNSDIDRVIERKFYDLDKLDD